MYVCPACGAKFERRLAYLKHLFTAHPDEFKYIEGRWLMGMYKEDMPGC
jgi:uncharacterized C2H2 Zn-finger protein